MKYPYHRYLTYQIFNGDRTPDIVAHMLDLDYIPPRIEDVDECRRRLGRRRLTPGLRTAHGLDFFDAHTPSAQQMQWLVETVVARTCVERLLLDRVHAQHVATIIGAKFATTICAQAIDYFRDGFWDTIALTAVDFGEYFHLGGQKKPTPPPASVSLATRGAYAAWKQGLQPDDTLLSPETMVREIQVDAFMRFKEASDREQGVDARAWAQLVLKTGSARNSLAAKSSGRVPEVRPLLEYPPTHVPTLGELHAQYAEAQTATGAESEAMGRRENGPKSGA